MNPQINFVITPSAEQTFLDYIVNDLKLEIVSPTMEESAAYTIGRGEIAAFQRLLFVDSVTEIDKNYQKNQNNANTLCLFPLDSEGNFLPIIQYHRYHNNNFDIATTCTTSFYCWLYANLEQMRASERTKIRTLMKKMRKWIQLHATRTLRDDNFKMYVLD